jgi:general stress protein 26
MGMTGKPAGNETNSPEKMWDLIRDIKFAMFTTRHGNGHLHSRPMTTQNGKDDEDDRLWFFMSKRSDPVSDLETEPTVNISYADPGEDCYVSVSGNARVVDDRAKKQALWSKLTEAWFPGGVDDPDLALVEVDITHAHYWDVKENKMTQLFKMAKAAITGKPPANMGETGEVRMQ